MKVYNDLDGLPIFKNAVITIGTFDGVHQGHRKILQQLIAEAERVSGEPVVITFYPHPKQIIDVGGKPLFLLNTPTEKYALLHRAGIHHIVEVPFTREFSEQPAEKYIENFLVRRFRPHTIIIGYDHRFGRDRQGDYSMLKSKESFFGFHVMEIPKHVLQEATISSTRIRQALLEGDVEIAHRYLGYPYFFSGLVVTGNQLGRSLGFPTANLKISHERKLIPANGVYAVWVEVPGHGVFQGMMNIGTRPTVEGTQQTTEVHILDFDNFIYGITLRIFLIGRIRDEEKFPDLEALKRQLESDKKTARELLSDSHHDFRNEFLEQ